MPPWIVAPANPEDWPNKFQPIPWVYAEIVRHLSRVEDVHILVNDLAAERRATSALKRGGANLARVHFHHWPTDRVWLRDSGPIFVKKIGATNDDEEDLAVTNWRFNAWAKYDNWRRDDQIPHHVARYFYNPSLRSNPRSRRSLPQAPPSSPWKAAPSKPTVPASLPQKSASSPRSSSATPVSAMKPRPAPSSNKPSTIT